MSSENVCFWTSLKTQELLSADNLENIKVPYVLEDKLLMSEGTHNSVYYPADELKNADIYDKRISLFFDHEDLSQTWVGEIIPKKFDDGSKEVRGDVVVVDKQTAMNLAYGAKFGLSPTIDVDLMERPDSPAVGLDPQFSSWSIVIKPAVKATMLNSSDGGSVKMNEEEIKKISDRVVQTLSEKGNYNSDVGQLGNQGSSDELELVKAEKQKVEEELSVYKEAEAKEQVFSIRAKEEFLSGSEDAFPSDRDEQLLKFEPSAREALESALDSMVSHKEELSKYTDFVKKYMKENKGATIKDAAKAYKKEQENADKKKDKNGYPYPDKKKKELESGGVSSRQSLSFDGGQESLGSGSSDEKMDKGDFAQATHAMMLKAQGGK